MHCTRSSACAFIYTIYEGEEEKKKRRRILGRYTDERPHRIWWAGPFSYLVEEEKMKWIERHKNKKSFKRNFHLEIYNLSFLINPIGNIHNHSLPRTMYNHVGNLKWDFVIVSKVCDKMHVKGYTKKKMKCMCAVRGVMIIFFNVHVLLVVFFLHFSLSLSFAAYFLPRKHSIYRLWSNHFSPSRLHRWVFSFLFHFKSRKRYVLP